MKMDFQRLFPGALLFASCASSLLLFATTARAADRQVLHGHVPTVVSILNLQPVGRLSATNRLHLAIGLPLRNQDALGALLKQIYDPASPQYHQYLTPEQFTEKFGPTEADYETVMEFAKANHLTVTATFPNRVLVDVEGTAADVEKALHVTMRVYEHPTEARTFYAPDTEPSLDLVIPILHIGGLDNYSIPRPNFRLKHPGSVPNIAPNAGSGPSSNYVGSDFRAAYVPGTTLTGSGLNVGLLQFDGYTASDITYYETLAGLPNVTLTNILIDGATGGPSGDGGEIEVSLDIEMVISMAPGVSNVILYIAPNPSPWEDLMQRMANDNYAKQISCSWGGGGPDPTAEAALVQMATQGQSFFCASGDSDAFTGAISFPADSTNLTAVGGTTLTTAGPTNIWVSETTWNWDVEFGSSDDGVGSSGGVSTYYSIPPWQQGVATTTNHGSSTMRNVPDVALTADNVYVRADGTDYDGVGGTSCAAPLWAAFTALVNQLAAGTGLGPVGFLNPALYTIGKGANYTNCFHDITTGNNEWSGSTTQYTAVAGYDLCTGWGTPTGTNLIYALARAGQQPILFPAGEVISGGNGDGVVDPNECVQIRLLVQNLGATASNITASITTPAVGVTVTQPLSGYPNISTGGTVTN
ncbi:MAG: protease pro-enzyme activation domain-containing protein, partial [Verrucomicrobiia bacterium]